MLPEMIHVGRVDKGGLAAGLTDAESYKESHDDTHDAYRDESSGPGGIRTGEGNCDLSADCFADVHTYVENTAMLSADQTTSAMCGVCL